MNKLIRIEWVSEWVIERHPSAFYAQGCYVTSMSKNGGNFVDRVNKKLLNLYPFPILQVSSNISASVMKSLWIVFVGNYFTKLHYLNMKKLVKSLHFILLKPIHSVYAGLYVVTTRLLLNSFWKVYDTFINLVRWLGTRATPDKRLLTWLVSWRLRKPEVIPRMLWAMISVYETFIIR